MDYTAARFRSRDFSAPWRHVDLALLLTVGGVVLIGSAMVYSATRTMSGAPATCSATPSSS